MKIDELIAGLRKEFPREVIGWRAQSVTRDGTKAQALAYIDSRDVQDRLNDVCGPFNWSSDHIVSNGGTKVTCKIGIKNPETGEWVYKSDGAGETDIEGEKGSYSDSTKRAAVSWGVGRYLYDIEPPWVPCESYKNGDKFKFSKFTADPWNFMKGQPASKPAPVTQPDTTIQHKVKQVSDAIVACKTGEQLLHVWKENQPHIQIIAQLDPVMFKKLEVLKDQQKQILGTK